MEFEYREISEERCKEIDSWEIRDSYGCGKAYAAERKNLLQMKMNQYCSVICLVLAMMTEKEIMNHTYLLWIKNIIW